jgi:thymidine kinase
MLRGDEMRPPLPAGAFFGHNRVMCGSGNKSPEQPTSRDNTCARSGDPGPAGADAAGAGRGTITFLTGCMFSGKTTELLRRLASCPAGTTLVFKHVIDRRYRTDAAVSHEGKSWPAVAITSAQEIAPHIGPATALVAVEEAHFFDDDIVTVAGALADRGICVILTALDCDSWGRPIPVAQTLLHVADEPIVTHAVCARCGAPAHHTQRLTPIVDGNLVGGPESYEPRCRTCWHPPPERPPDRAWSVIRHTPPA